MPPSTRWGRFQPNFRWLLAAKLLKGPKNVCAWNDGTDHLYHHAEVGRNRTTHVGVIERTSHTRPNGRKWRSCVIQDESASVFVDRFRCSLQRFFWMKSFSIEETALKIVARWRYDWCTNARENFQNRRKWVQSLFAPLRPCRSKMKEKFYNIILPYILWMCTRMKIFR